MSEIEITNERVLKVTNIPTAVSGELNWHDRTTRRGKSAGSSEHRTYVAIFTFSEPLVCAEDAVPERGGYFLLENGSAEVTQLIGRFSTEAGRSHWVREQFSFDNDQQA